MALFGIFPMNHPLPYHDGRVEVLTRMTVPRRTVPTVERQAHE
jgi:hypothetical protein